MGQKYELIGTYLLYQIDNIISKGNRIGLYIGLHREEELGIFKNMSPPEAERKKKDLIKDI